MSKVPNVKNFKEIKGVVEDLTKRRLFYTNAFSIYGGVAGLYDFGPAGCGLKNNIENLWRFHFIIKDKMLEISCTNLTPEIVFKTSGHVEKFTDLLVKSDDSGECFRADKLLEEEIENMLETGKLKGNFDAQRLKDIKSKCDSFTDKEMDEILRDLEITKKYKLGPCYYFNLMFKTNIGPLADRAGYLRPETAQGMFMNFKRLLEQNQNKMPFAAAQVGLGFRNEIAPRGGLARCREFPMAEIEHFVHPDFTDHPKFKEVADLRLPLFSREHQEALQDPNCDLTLAEAVSKGVMSNETLAYFIGRTFLFLTKIGIDKNFIRFRQHLKKQMAHYARDCWDAEILCSSGWLECVGIADRSAYDLSNHSKGSKEDLVATFRHEKPIKKEILELKINKGVLGPAFRDQQKVVIEELENLTESDKVNLEKELKENGKFVLKSCKEGPFEILPSMLSLKKVEKLIHEETFTPNVIEPAFGIGRILNCVIEHTFRMREDLEDGEKRYFLSLPACVAPYKVGIVGVSKNDQFTPLMEELDEVLTEMGLSVKFDDSAASIGKKYARIDEVGTPFTFTVDFQTLQDKTVTLRERDSMEQIRLPIEKATELVYGLCSTSSYKAMTWEKACEIYGKLKKEQ